MDSRNEIAPSLIPEDQRQATSERIEKLMLDGLDCGQPIYIDNLDAHFAEKKAALRSNMIQANRP